MASYTSFARPARHRSEVGMIGPLLFFLVAIGVLVWTLPRSGSGVQIPGARRLQAVVDQIPLPWKPPRPVHVPLPDSAVDVGVPVAPAAAPVVNPPSEPAAVALPSVASSAPAVASPALPAPPANFRLEGFRHQWQTWNNCGPATITMATSFYGRTETQAQAAAFLKPNANDKNVNPDEIVAYVRSVGLSADWLVAGDLDRLKQLIANGIPVMVETWFTPHPNDGMGHYRLLIGYDDAARQFIAYDSYQAPGLNVRLPYDALDADWRVFNRTYIPVYPADRVSTVDAIVGADRDDVAMRQRALADAQREIEARPNDAYGWFNTGTNLVALGRYDEAVAAFDKARALRLPWRMLWYQFAPFEAYLAVGRIGDVLTLTGANLQQAADLEESQFYRGRALEAQGQVAQAKAAYQAAVRANPKFTPALHALAQLG